MFFLSQKYVFKHTQSAYACIPGQYQQLIYTNYQNIIINYFGI